MTSLSSLVFSFSLPVLLIAACSDSDEGAPPTMLSSDVHTELGGAGGAMVAGASLGGSGAQDQMVTMGGATSDPALDCGTCGFHEECVAAGDGEAECRCLKGFEGPSCRDVDECADGSAVCGQNEHCANLQGGYECLCDSGYQRAGDTCVWASECSLADALCDDRASCDDQLQGHTCTCGAGYVGDGVFCKAASDCLGDPCNGERCFETPDSFRCECSLGSAGQACDAVCALDEAIDFADSTVKDAVRQLVGVAGEVTPAQLAGLDALSLSGETSDWAGLQCWPTLKELRLGEDVRADSAVLSQLGGLQHLELSCPDDEILTAISKLGALRTLTIHGEGCPPEHQVADLQFTENLTSLRELIIEHHQIQDLASLTALTRLERLELPDGEISDIDGVSRLGVLKHLELSENPVEDLQALAGLGFLETLNIHDAHIKDIQALATLGALRELDLRNNQIASTDSLRNHLSLRRVRLAGNYIEELSPFAASSQIQFLDVARNQISSLSSLASADEGHPAELWVMANLLDCEASQTDFKQLESLGVVVLSGCP